jgi:hypothetical protein
MKKKHIAAIAAVGAALLAAFPYQITCMTVAVATFGAVGIAGAWFVDRFGDLPGGDRRCA